MLLQTNAKHSTTRLDSAFRRGNDEAEFPKASGIPERRLRRARHGHRVATAWQTDAWPTENQMFQCFIILVGSLIAHSDEWVELKSAKGHP